MLARDPQRGVALGGLVGGGGAAPGRGRSGALQRRDALALALDARQQFFARARAAARAGWIVVGRHAERDPAPSASRARTRGVPGRRRRRTCARWPTKRHHRDQPERDPHAATDQAAATRCGVSQKCTTTATDSRATATVRQADHRRSTRTSISCRRCFSSSHARRSSCARSSAARAPSPASDAQPAQPRVQPEQRQQPSSPAPGPARAGQREAQRRPSSRPTSTPTASAAPAICQGSSCA